MSTSRASAPGLIASELGLVFRRRRNTAMLAVLGAAPVIVGIALRVTSPDAGAGGAPAFLGQVTNNGLFLGFSALILLTPFFMPLTVAVVSGESIAGEAAAGTLRYVLTVPVSRGRLLGAKYLAIVAFALAAAGVVVLSGMLTGMALFPIGDVTLLSGNSIGLPPAMGRAALMACYATAMLAGLAAVGVFVSTLTEVPMAAMVTTAAVPIVSQILGAIPQLSGLHQWLLTDTWRVYGDFLREPIVTDAVSRGLWTQVGYIAVFGSLAWARFTTRDVTT